MIKVYNVLATNCDG